MTPTPQGHDTARRRSGIDNVPDTFLAHPAPSVVPTSEPAAGTTDREAFPAEPFPSARRGYLPAAVDEHLGRLQKSLLDLRAALDESERRRDRAEQHALAVEDEIRVVRAGGTGARTSAREAAEPEAGFGARAERMLRLAETEAADVRAQSARSANELLDRTRREAEQYRHDAEEQAIAAAGRAEEHAARRTATVQEREDALRDHLAAVRSEADGIRVAALRAAEAHRASAETAARDERERAARDVGRTRAEAVTELSRLHSLRQRAREDLGSLAAALQAAVDVNSPTAAGEAAAGVR